MSINDKISDFFYQEHGLILTGPQIDDIINVILESSSEEVEINIMTKKDLKNLDTGDIVKHHSNGRTYIVTANYGDRVTAVRTVDITNPREWEICEKATYKKQ